jgi:hypothetical protein
VARFAINRSGCWSVPWVTLHELARATQLDAIMRPSCNRKEQNRMSKFLQVRIEFLANEDRGELTPQVLSDSVRSVFLDAGISEEAVSAGVKEVRLEKVTPLDIGPGTAAVLVALIGVSVELIKLGVELMKQDKELALKKREVALKEQEFEARKTPEKVSEGNEHELLQEFVEEILLAQFLEQRGISPTTVMVQIEER